MYNRPTVYRCTITANRRCSKMLSDFDARTCARYNTRSRTTLATVRKVLRKMKTKIISADLGRRTKNLCTCATRNSGVPGLSKSLAARGLLVPSDTEQKLCDFRLTHYYYGTPCAYCNVNSVREKKKIKKPLKNVERENVISKKNHWSYYN